MAQTIKLRRSATPSTVPTTGQLSLGELAINTYDGKLYLKKSVSGVESIVDVTASSGGGSVSISTTAPASPTTGTLWWNSEEGKLKVYYNDGNTSQWVDAFTGTAGPNVVSAATLSSITGLLKGSGGYVAAASAGVDYGYANMPLAGGAAQTAGYLSVLADAGCLVVMNGSSITYTIPANSSVAFPVGTVISVANINATNLSIAINADTLTMAGTTLTGTRTLLSNGLATAIKVSSTSWLITGTGLT